MEKLIGKYAASIIPEGKTCATPPAARLASVYRCLTQLCAAGHVIECRRRRPGACGRSVRLWQWRGV